MWFVKCRSKSANCCPAFKRLRGQHVCEMYAQGKTLAAIRQQWGFVHNRSVLNIIGSNANRGRGNRKRVTAVGIDTGDTLVFSPIITCQTMGFEYRKVQYYANSDTPYAGYFWRIG